MSKHIPLKRIDKERWITEPKLNWSKKYSEAELKYFNKKIPVIERANWLTKLIDKYFYWVILAVLISATVWVWWKIWELHLIRLWLRSI
jgi:hypothetical protein